MFWLFLLLILQAPPVSGWGFFAHRRINQYSVYLLPPSMLAFYKYHHQFIIEHSVHPDRRRYIIKEEGPRHYIDIDHYGSYPYLDLPRNFNAAIEKFSADTIHKYGIVPWWIGFQLGQLTAAFQQQDVLKILRISAELGHYISDAHVPLHACRNHNGQYSGQKGIHAFWESRIPELLADNEWDFFLSKAVYLQNPSEFIWKRVLESAAAADTVLQVEKKLSISFPPDQRYAFEWRNGKIERQFSTAYSLRYNMLLGGMVERRMQQSVHAIASFWYTAWVNAGQPELVTLARKAFTAQQLEELAALQKQWLLAGNDDH